MIGGGATTEAEWRACEDPKPMLGRVVGKVSARKLRLFACACCRRFWGLLNGVAQRAVAVGEDYAEGVVGRDGAERCRETFNRLKASPAGAILTVIDDANITRSMLPIFGHEFLLWTADRRQYSSLLREIIGDQAQDESRFLPPTTPDAHSLAQAAYDERALPSRHLEPARLAVLSDALEEAGCADASLLSHLRSADPHVRGCWALDLVLSKR